MTSQPVPAPRNFYDPPPSDDGPSYSRGFDDGEAKGRAEAAAVQPSGALGEALALALHQSRLSNDEPEYDMDEARARVAAMFGNQHLQRALVAAQPRNNAVDAQGNEYYDPDPAGRAAQPQPSGALREALLDRIRTHHSLYVKDFPQANRTQLFQRALAFEEWLAQIAEDEK